MEKKHIVFSYSADTPAGKVIEAINEGSFLQNFFSDGLYTGYPNTGNSRELALLAGEEDILDFLDACEDTIRIVDGGLDLTILEQGFTVLRNQLKSK